MLYPYGRQNVTEEDKGKVLDVLNSDFLTQGEVTPQFEDKISNYVSCKHVLALNSATSALHVSYLAAGIGKHSVVWTSPITFVATSNAALFCGATVKFIDIEYLTGNIDINKLETELIKAQATNQLPDLLVVVHMGGSPVDMKAINSLKIKYDFKVIEDSSHAMGAEYYDSKVGSCLYSDLSVFSFHPVKMITTGEGGAITTNQSDLYETCKLLRSHGIERDHKKMIEKPEGDWKYEQQILGYNYRISDINSALGLSQLKRIDEIVRKRRSLINLYIDLFKNCDFGKLIEEIPNTKSSYHLALFRLSKVKSVEQYKLLFDSLRSKGLGVQLHYYPIHLQSFYKNLGWKEGDFPIAEKYSYTTLSIPLYEKLEDKDIYKIVNLMKKTFTEYKFI